jgi:hypothetical protein
MELLLFCFFWPIFKNIYEKKLSNNRGLIPIPILMNSKLWNSEFRKSELRNSKLRNSWLRHALDYSENSGSRIAELRTSGSALRKYSGSRTSDYQIWKVVDQRKAETLFQSRLQKK